MDNIIRYFFLGLIGGALTVLPGCKGAEELPAKEIRPELRQFGGLELPRKAEGLRAILSHCRAPRIFVKFETDSEGIEHVLKTFGGPGVKSEALDANDLKEITKFGGSLFPEPLEWQKMIGVCLFDEKSLSSGLLLERKAPRANQVGWQVFIEDKSKTVYIFAYFI
jgi:hypothetical protein